MDKKGFLRIVEASISIFIIMGVLFVFFNQQKAQVQEGADLSERAREILEEASKNITLREAVLAGDNDTLNNFFEVKIPETYLSFEVRICDVDAVCGKSEFREGNIYSGERVISSTINELGPKKIRLFIWEEVRGE